MAGDDIREDQMTVSSSVDYVRGLKGKDSVLMSISDFFSNAIISRGNLMYSDQQMVDKTVTPGMYAHGGEIVGSGGFYGILLVVRSSIYIAQIDFTANGKILYRFSSNNGANWNQWKSVTLT